MKRINLMAIALVFLAIMTLGAKVYIDGVEKTYEVDSLWLKTIGTTPPIPPTPPVPPTPPPLPPIPPTPPPPSNAIPMAFGTSTNWDLGAGVVMVYSFDLKESGKSSLKLNLYGRSPTTNAIYKWIFPDGTEFPKYFTDRGLYVPDTIVGSSSSGGFEARAKNSSSPNVSFPSIPTGVHILKITAISGSSIGIWVTLK